MSANFDIARFLDDFAAAAAGAGFRCRELAATAAGPMNAWRRPGAGPRVYVSAGIHGDEPAGPLTLLELMRAGTFNDGCDWALCPALNPTGLAAGRRRNAEGIDLNRDYLNRSSSEVRAHAGWLESRQLPDLFLSLHEDWETSGFYLYEINLGADLPARARGIVTAVTPLLATEPQEWIDDHLVREPGWIYHAAEPDLPQHWPEAIFLAKLGCPLSFTFETPSRAPLVSRVAAHAAAVRAALDGWLAGLPVTGRADRVEE